MAGTTDGLLERKGSITAPNNNMTSSMSNFGVSLFGDTPNSDYTNLSGTESMNQMNSDYRARDLSNQDSLLGRGGMMDQGLGQFGKLAGGASSLANVYLGFQNLGIAKEKMGIFKEQWQFAKDELKHMQATRTKITNKFNS